MSERVITGLAVGK